jgi:hypothetical protein
MTDQENNEPLSIDPVKPDLSFRKGFYFDWRTAIFGFILGLVVSGAILIVILGMILLVVFYDMPAPPEFVVWGGLIVAAVIPFIVGYRFGRD